VSKDETAQIRSKHWGMPVQVSMAQDGRVPVSDLLFHSDDGIVVVRGRAA
jgi:hypothetical protein